nr:helix-turn-helix transcriptional regulator [Microbacterium sp. CFBP 13617]
MIPAVECADLVEAAAEDHPELAGTAASIRDALLQLAARPHAAPPARDVPGLTPTEHALAALLATGSSLAQIARERGVSVNTVKSQVRSIYVKLGVSTRAQAVAHLSADA